MRGITYSKLPAGTKLTIRPYGYGGSLLLAVTADPPNNTGGPRDLIITAYLEAIRTPTTTRFTWVPTWHRVRRNNIRVTPAPNLQAVTKAEQAWMTRAGFCEHERLRAHIDRTRITTKGTL